ncbi:Poly [ADP-ribose] polymerase 2 [Geranomyces michiganensis]|nr:Poly [ADP-ribose] polymerase 2 [Geranomyces michiganensis]
MSSSRRSTRSSVASASSAAPPATAVPQIFDGQVFTLTTLAARLPANTNLSATLTAHGAKVVASVTKSLTCLIAVPDDVTKASAKWKQASQRSDIAIVDPSFVADSIKKGALADPADYTVVAAAAPAVAATADQSDDDNANDAPASPKKRKRSATTAKGTTDTKKSINSDSENDANAAVRPPAKKASAAATKSAASKSAKAAKKADDKDDKDKDDADNVITPVVVAPKMVKTIKKGRAAVDHEFPHASQCHVFEDSSGAYDAMLNQTEVSNNNNKFYIIQVLKDDNADAYYVWNRWGRVGARGQTSKFDRTSKEVAITHFKAKFQDKTRNHWDDRHNFEKKPGKYYLIERDFGDDENDDGEDDEAKAIAAKEAAAARAKIPPSKLPQPVQNLMKLIFNTDMMTKEMVALEYDANKMPLGKLTKAQIKKGYEALAQLSDVLNAPVPNNSLIDQYTSLFYTIIPHNFGMRRPQLINTPQLLKAKLQMVEALGDIEIATEIINATNKNLEKDPVDLHHDKLHTKFSVVEPNTETYKLVEKYMKNTHASTHGGYELEIEDLFEIQREGEEKRAQGLHNKKLLWHGSRLTNYVGILSTGLRIAPPEAPVTGYMFGKGIYFADMVSKSANYCFTSRNSPTGLLLLCEVALGNQWKTTTAEYNAEQISKAAGCHSTHGQGTTMPDPKMETTIPGEPDVVVPCGKGVPSGVPRGHLLYNEFITYDVENVKIRNSEMGKRLQQEASSAMAKRRRDGDHMDPTPSANTTDAAAITTISMTDAEAELLLKLDSAFSRLSEDADADEFMQLAEDVLGPYLPNFLAVMKRMFSKRQAQKRVASVKTEKEGDIESQPEEQAEDERAVL